MKQDRKFFDTCEVCKEKFRDGITVWRTETGWVHPECAHLRKSSARRTTNDWDRYEELIRLMRELWFFDWEGNMTAYKHCYECAWGEMDRRGMFVCKIPYFTGNCFDASQFDENGNCTAFKEREGMKRKVVKYEC